MLLVPKPDGTGRLCVDFRRLNALNEPDPFPLPRIGTLLDRLGGARFMTKLDMTKAYFQVPIAPHDRPLTGFVSSRGHFQWRYMATENGHVSLYCETRRLSLHSVGW